ncbi:hypothetical protein B0T17DRAFT_305696 [Bombardia bombarda]|uniref:Uncharacterized protein n=1 Tax=Bombardia bombarda TaxID=252184 RepID=A0AA40C2D7_9PEZI|nr:hypothetical protein B0T17DRAFT_305696 [Bombardia bombarda]
MQAQKRLSHTDPRTLSMGPNSTTGPVHLPELKPAPKKSQVQGPAGPTGSTWHRWEGKVKSLRWPRTWRIRSLATTWKSLSVPNFGVASSAPRSNTFGKGARASRPRTVQVFKRWTKISWP